MTVIALDIGGVLIENAGYDALRSLLARPMTDQEVKTLWLSSKAVTEFETGRISPSEFGNRAVLEFELDLTPEQFLREFKTWPRGFFPGAKALVKKLRQRYRTGCISNSNEMHWHVRYNEMFDFAISSHRSGIAKPAFAIFEVLERVAKSPRQDIYFFDDSLANVEAASAFGLRAYLAEGFESLVSALHEAGISLAH